MKRIITFLLVAFSISQLSWGQEYSSQNSQSPFVGEWTGIYNFADYQHKLVIKIDQYGLDLSVRVKEIFEFGGTSYWEYCEITDVQSTEISFTKKTDRQYSDMWGDFYRVSTFKIQYDKGKLHLIPIKQTLYKHCTSNSAIEEDESSMNNMLNIYLYKNDNW